jgi:GNAT superfamily N-acetyltransferase
MRVSSDTRDARLELVIRPLTPELWPAFEDLFNTKGPCGRCWCMYGRIGADYRRRAPRENKAAFREIVKNGPSPGLLAFDRDLAIGWCQLTPREAVPALDRFWRIARVDDVPVWALSCLYVRIGYRRRGVTAALIEAAIAAARRAKAPALEAYPFDAAVSPSSSNCGYASTFAKAGFKVVARRDSARPIMRHALV